MFPGRRAVSRFPPARGVMESVRDGCETATTAAPAALPGGGGAGNKQFLQQLLSSLIYVSTAGG